MTNPRPSMACGHTANATNAAGNPCCVVCWPDPKAAEIVTAPDLTGRWSKCPACGSVVASDPSLPFFAHRPDREYARHYDGCRGFD